MAEAAATIFAGCGVLYCHDPLYFVDSAHSTLSGV